MPTKGKPAMVGGAAPAVGIIGAVAMIMLAIAALGMNDKAISDTSYGAPIPSLKGVPHS